MSVDSIRRKLIFHIGHHKTGSTTIQDAFATGRVGLRGARILYPAQMAHNYLRKHVDTFLESGRILPGRPGMPGLTEIKARLAKGGFDHVVISGEEFEGADPAGLNQVIERFFHPHVEELRVVCYLRPHAARVVSSFAEQMKLGLFDGTPEEFHARSLQNARFLYAQRLAPWQQVFGPQLQVRPMIRSELSQGSVLHDFMVTAFGADSPIRCDEAGRANEALCLEDLVMVRLVQQRLKGQDRRLRHAMGWELAMNLAAAARGGKPGTRPALHRSLAEQIRMDYREDARASDRMFFDGRPLLETELDRAVDEAVSSAQSFEPEDHFSADALRGLSVLGDVINGMLEHDGSGDWPGFLLKRRVASVHGGQARSPREKPAADVVRKKRAVNLDSVVRLIDEARDDSGYELLSRRLGNLLMLAPEGPVMLTAGRFQAWMEARTLPAALRGVLEEFLLHLFFHGFAAEIAGQRRKETPAELAGGGDDLGAVLARLKQAGGVIPAMAEAGIHYLRGDFQPAYARFDEARLALLQGAPQRHHNRGLLSLRTLPVLADWAAHGTKPELPPMEFESDRKFGDDLPIVVVGVDAGYYRRYAARLVETARGQANLHFHVANPAGLEFIAAPHLRHTVETSPGASNAYFATMRFLRLPTLLKHYDRPLMTADADSYFTGSPQPLFDMLGNYDVLLNAADSLESWRANLAAVPWRHVTAQLFLVRPEAGAFEFLDIMGRIYAGLTGDAAMPNWWIDQALLATSADICLYEDRSPRIGRSWLHPMSGMKQGKM